MLYAQLGDQALHLFLKGFAACLPRPSGSNFFLEPTASICCFEFLFTGYSFFTTIIFFIVNNTDRLIVFCPIRTLTFLMLCPTSCQVICVSNVNAVIFTSYCVNKEATWTRRRQVVFDLGRANVTAGGEDVVVAADVIERGALAETGDVLIRGYAIPVPPPSVVRIGDFFNVLVG